MKKGEKLKKPRVYHGLTHSKVRNVWRHMMRRCYDKTSPFYFRYGGRGIQVCERWHDLLNFFADMGHPPQGLTLERINNNGNYEPSNCKWATQAEQQRNRRSNRYLEFGGKRQLISDWAIEIGISHGALTQRLSGGMSVEEALTRPVGRWVSR